MRTFHNVCRHRGSRVAIKTKGQCRSALVCPFHGWSYNLDGTLRSPARPARLPKLDPVEFGLNPVDCEIWPRFVFVRFNRSEQPPGEECMVPFESEAALHTAADHVPAS